MRKISIIFLILSSFNIYGQNGSKNFIDLNYIEVTGKAEMEITPDKIYIQIQLSEKDDKNKLTITDRENQMFKKLEEIGVDLSKDLVIKDISSNFKFYFLSKSDIFLTKEYQILVRDGKMASRIFLELEKIGVSNISIEKLDNSRIEEYRKETKVNAIKAARDKAELLIQSIDQEIGRAIYIMELDNVIGYASGAANNIRIRGVSSLYKSRSSGLEVDFEKIKLEYSILCRFELK